MAEQGDRILRAMTDDGSFRALTLRGTEMVRQAVAAQQATGDVARLLGELLCASVLVRETMAPNMRVQTILGTNPTRFTLVADSRPGGMTRGLASPPEDGSPVALGDGVYLQVVRVLYSGELQQGIVATDPHQGLSQALEAYMINSEQITTLIQVRCVMEGDEVKTAGGYIVQVLPGASQAAIATTMVRAPEIADAFDAMSATRLDPEGLMEIIFEPFEFTPLANSTISFGCDCSEMKVVGALASLGRVEIEQIVARGEVLDIHCDYCATHYQIGPQQLKPLLDSN